MKKMYLLLATVFCFCILSCSIGNSDNTPAIGTENASFDKQWAHSFIDSINSRFSEQFAAGDSTALASHYWPDSEILLSNSEAIKGPDILSAWGSMTRMGIKEFNFTTTDLKGDAQFLIETGKYEMKDDKNTLVDKGKYVVVWEKRNGEWKLYRDIGNTSLPASK